MAELFTPTISDAIAELEREMKMRERVYPRFIERGNLTRVEADRRNARLRYAIEVLRRHPEFPG